MATVLKATDPLIVPVRIRRLAGLKTGDRVEFKATRGVITIVSRSQPLAAETSSQRRIIDVQLAEGLDDIRKGRVSRRFDSVEEMLKSLKGPSLPGTKKVARTSATRSR